ncbi:hypothetical protein HNQ80_001532 [Anaerosolibacter carboniphilus]|uniref:Uncharacterized protein n=1 Tax=Anaerosolibacter carboniphilus TaxID=1417629 RepID=A0A841KPT8_9FIRM|nr:hypothetical protein [Anaerosolibacter carboniphilus]
MDTTIITTLIVQLTTKERSLIVYSQKKRKKRQSKLNKFISQLLYNGEETCILQQLKPMIQSEDKITTICFNHKKYH